MTYGNDPLWKLRHALAGVALALLLAVLGAAFAGSLLGDVFGGGYGLRAGIYSALLLYVVVGAVGSSRVDLQACKLEYSIVSPK